MVISRTTVDLGRIDLRLLVKRLTIEENIRVQELFDKIKLAGSCTDQKTLASLARHPNEIVRYVVVANKRTNEGTLRGLATDQSPAVRSAASVELLRRTCRKS
jgi:hypothetical protein